MAASVYHAILKEVENRIPRHNRTPRHTFTHKQPILISSGRIIFLWKYYIAVPETLICSWVCLSGCSLLYY